MTIHSPLRFAGQGRLQVDRRETLPVWVELQERHPFDLCGQANDLRLRKSEGMVPARSPTMIRPTRPLFLASAMSSGRKGLTKSSTQPVAWSKSILSKVDT